MRQCAYCENDELCGIGVENIPVCEKHFNDYLAGKRLEIEQAIEAITQRKDNDTYLS